MKICILTQSLHTNYGGLLQAFALQTVLKRMGHEVVTDENGAERGGFIFRILRFGYHFTQRFLCGNKQYTPFQYLFHFMNRGWEAKQKQIAIHTDRFIEHHISTTDFFCGQSSPHAATAKLFNVLVVGSDQVWRPAYSFVPAYFLDFPLPDGIRCLAYAASFGRDDMNEYTPSVLKRCRRGASHFDGISVREDSGVLLCREHLGVEALHVLDPTMLLEKEDYLSVIEEPDRLERQKVMMCYVLDKSPEKQIIIQCASNRLGLTPLEVMPKENITPETQELANCIYPSVSAWIAGFRDADFVITDSFHGTVFAIIFSKPFIVIYNAERGASRFISLLKIFGLEHRLIHSATELTDSHFSPIYNRQNIK